MFDKGKVFYRANININVAWGEIRETFEDAIMLSQEVSSKTTSSEIKIRDLVLDQKDEIDNLVDIGKDVTGTTPLFTLVSNVVSDDKLDKETMDLLQSFIKVSPKAKYKGKLIKVKVYYNADYKDLSKSLKNLVDISKKYMKDEISNKEVDGKVNSSYNINGVPLAEGKLHIKFYIDVNRGLLPGDKGTIANQLKSTLTTIYDYPIVSSNDKEKIDALFSFKGVLARIVNSPTLMGTTATLLKKISDQAVEMYFK